MVILVLFFSLALFHPFFGIVIAVDVDAAADAWAAVAVC